MNKKRPVNIDLTTLRFPIMAIASILHRLSGIILFLCLPFLLYCLDRSLRSSFMFSKTVNLLHNFSLKVLIWLFLSALIYHVLAGIRHLIMDLGFAENVNKGRLTAVVVMSTSLILAILVGIWVW